MATIDETQNFFSLSDGQELFYQVFRPSKPKGCLVIIHGLGEHCGRYKGFCRYLAKKGWVTYTYDQRGHGKTPGLRSYVDDFQNLVDDLQDFITFVKKSEKRLKLFLLGHSFGGQVAINFLAQFPKLVHGALLSSPNIRLALRVPWLKRCLGKWVSILLPSLTIPNDVNPDYISHDHKVIEAYSEDRLVQRKISLRLGAELLDNLEEIEELAPHINTPCFLFHGSEDKITNPLGTEEFFQNISSKDRQLKIYPGFYHETLNEIGKERVYRDITQWLSDRI